jgi:hypothetical protein
MGSLQQKVLKAIRKGLGNDICDGLETVNGRVTGWIASDAFKKLDDRKRQARLWRVIKQELDPEELANIGPIVTLSPAEAELDVSRD